MSDAPERNAVVLSSPFLALFKRSRHYFLLFSVFVFIRKTVRTNNIGNTMALMMPIFKLPPRASATAPTIVGPEEHPRSPARARSANIAVPPVGKDADAILNVPGHRMPTEKPQTAQPMRPNTGCGAKLAIR